MTWFNVIGCHDCPFACVDGDDGPPFATCALCGKDLGTPTVRGKPRKQKCHCPEMFTDGLVSVFLDPEGRPCA